MGYNITMVYMTEDEIQIERMKSLSNESTAEQLQRVINTSEVLGACKTLMFLNSLEGAGFNPRLTEVQIIEAAYKICGVERKAGDNQIPEIHFKEPNRLDMVE